MSKSLAVDKNNDLFIRGDGRLAVNDGLASVMQCAAHAAKSQFGEMVFAVDEGVPNFQTIWESAANVAQYQSFLRRTILATTDVLEVKELDTVVRDNALFYTATIVTPYGETFISGAING